ncbi:unnamed protein product [Symbiodinium microadriaticum]|nr:unnamed protein product [Symbiodinium microadriaticum]
MQSKLTAEVLKHDELQAVSIDCTMRCCLPLLGQVHPRSSKEDKERAAFRGEDARTRVMTLRGRTGAVMVLEPIATDESEACVRTMADRIPSRGLGQIQFVRVDNPSKKFWEELRLICPNLQVMALDPVHLAMTYEFASSRKRTPGSKMLRLVLSKLTARDDQCSGQEWGPTFSGSSCRPLTHEEDTARNHIESRSMKSREAERILKNLDPQKPFYFRLDFIKAIAAICSVYSEEVKRIAPGPNRPVYKLLHSATAAGRAEWYFNNTRMLHSMASSRLTLLPTGTTSNESLHREINVWFRETYRLHQTSLYLKLSILKLAKNLSHNAALYRPTTRQMKQAEVLARVTSESVWSGREWNDWCSELDQEGVPAKANLPWLKERKRQQAEVKKSVRKKPAASKDQRRTPVHRTPHTLKRKDSLRRAGVRQDVCKKRGATQ